MDVQQTELTWKEVVVEALTELGGEGQLADINRLVQSHPKTQTNPTWRDTIRRVVRQYKVFQPVPPERSGVYRLVSVEAAQLRSQNIESKDAEINHGTAQGMLLALGGMYGYETFVPATDQTIREFQGKRLADLVTVKNCSDIALGRNVSKIREIDVLWFDEDDDGLYPVYAFEVEHTTGVHKGLDRLLKIPTRFNARLFILGPSDEEKGRFDRYLSQTPFRDHRSRFAFRMYDELEGAYNAALQHQTARDSFGLVERRRRSW